MRRFKSVFLVTLAAAALVAAACGGGGGAAQSSPNNLPTTSSREAGESQQAQVQLVQTSAQPKVRDWPAYIRGELERQFAEHRIGYVAESSFEARGFNQLNVHVILTTSLTQITDPALLVFYQEMLGSIAKMANQAIESGFPIETLVIKVSDNETGREVITPIEQSQLRSFAKTGGAWEVLVSRVARESGYVSN